MQSAILFFDRQAALLYNESGGSRRLLCQVPFATNTPSARQAAAAYLLGYATARGYHITSVGGTTPHLRMSARLCLQRLDSLVTQSAAA